MNDVRPSPIAGTWYDANPKTLAAGIDSYLNNAQPPELDGQVLAVIVPHAGHVYSGQVAAQAFKTLQGSSPELVIVLAPYHDFTPHLFLTSAHRFYSTPLGNIEVDSTTLAELQKDLELPITAIANDREHALEIELPFLQRTLKNSFKLLPLMVRARDADTAKQLGAALAQTIKNKNAVMVASTDLSHFYDTKTAAILDHEMLRRFETIEPQAIFEAEQTGRGYACGHAAVASMLWAAKLLGAHKVTTLSYATSGDITGDHSSVVGYGAAVVLKKI